VMPPLRVRPRTGSGSDESGSSRQGIVTEVGSDGRVRVNCGLQHPVSLPVPADLAVPDEGERVTVRVSSRRPVRAKLEGGPPPGFVVGAADLDTALARTDAGLTVAASRHGAEVTVTTLDQLVERIRDDDGTPADEDDTATTGGRQPTGDLTVAFGAPERGLPAIRDVDPEWVGDAVLRGIGDAGGAMDSEEPSDDRRFDLWLNTVPNQGSEVVRTEEAMFATLALLSLKR
jgi:predicted SPOUT superfamily RNA methylase MTH1